MLVDVARAFTKLGLTSFGGPVAHIGLLRAELVERRGWLSEHDFAELLALCQFLPGPASSQLVFAIGMRRAGLLGALVASLCFTAPSAVLMIGFAVGVARVDVAVTGAGWLHGLKLAAVAVVAHAVFSMARTLCPDRARLGIALASAAGLALWPIASAQLTVLAGGALAGLVLYRRTVTAEPAHGVGSARAGAAALVCFSLLLLALPLLARLSGLRALEVFDAFYRAGALVFGGGHVVLPLLRAEVVPHGWLTDAQFLSGYAAAQAVPGPLFTFAGYLGAAMSPGPLAWAHGLWALAAIFLPAWLLVGGALPFWGRLRGAPGVQAALVGANAAVVGVLLAALYRPVLSEGLHGPIDAALALVGFVALTRFKVPAWSVVAACAAYGALLS